MITADSQRAWIMPGTALVFSVVVMFLAPLYGRTFGPAMPAFTHSFFSAYPLWLVFSTAALAITALAGQFPVFARWRALWTGLDMLLNLLSVVIVAGGLIALFLPLLIPPIPD